jgi:hypothetical protein
MSDQVDLSRTEPSDEARHILDMLVDLESLADAVPALRPVVPQAGAMAWKRAPSGSICGAQ